MKNDAERKQEVVNRLIGAWSLVAWFETKPNGERVYPLGQDAIGQIMYSVDGHVAAQLACRQPERLRSDDWRQASETESARAWKQYFGYFGRFSIDLEANAVIHHVEGAWFPNLINTKQTRHFQFEGSRLVLNADTEWGTGPDPMGTHGCRSGISLTAAVLETYPPRNNHCAARRVADTQPTLYQAPR